MTASPDPTQKLQWRRLWLTMVQEQSQVIKKIPTNSRKYCNQYHFWYNENVIHILKTRWSIIVMLLLVLSGLAGGQVYAQDQEGRAFFPETGHWVTGPFLEKFNSVLNPKELFGNPITDAFQDQVYGFIIQYFEKVRFEYHPEEIPDLQVKISPLGSYLYKPGPTLPAIFNRTACRFYGNVSPGYYVCYDFLKFFLKNGGVSQFGYPISNFEIQDGWIVQYFQRARFEWHPENPQGTWVTVSDLGEQYFYLQNENPNRRNPTQIDNIPPQSLLDIKVRAFVASPIMPLSGNQTLYVIVQDQVRGPVANAEVVFTLRYPGRAEQTLGMNPTNQRGITSIQFPVNMDTPGTIEILVTARYGTFVKQTKTSFQIWW